MAEPFSFDDTGWPMPRPRQRRRTAQPPAPVTPEEESSLWSNMIGGLAAAGNLIDLPFSMARDVATLNNPFDQLATPLSSENRMTGRNVLEQYGVVPKNRYQGFDSWKHALDRPSDILGDLAGFAVEMVPLPGVFNPAGWITGPLGTLAKGSSVGARTARTGLKAAKSNPAKVLDKAGELAEATVHYGAQTAKGARPTDFLPTTPAAIADQIRRGERGVFGLANPITGEQVASFGAGSETAANLLDWMFYSESPLTLPVRAARALFSASAGAKPGEGMIAKTSARLGDKPGEMSASALSGALQKQKDLKYAYIEQSRAALQDLMPAMTAARGQLDDLYTSATNHLMEAGDEVGARKLAEAMAEHDLRQLAETPGFMPEAAMGYEQALSAPVRQPIEQRLSSFLKSSLDPGMDPVAHKAIDDLVHEAYPLLVSIQKAEDQVALQVEKLGGKIDWLNTPYVRHEARRGPYRDPSKPHYSRKEPYRDYPGGTIGVNEWAASPIMSLNRLPKAEQDKAIKEMYGWLHSQGRAWKGMKRADILEQYAEYALLRPHLDEATDRISRLAAPGTEIPNPEDTLAAWKEVTKRKRTVKGQVKEYETSRLSDMVRYFTNLPATEKQFGKIFANSTLEDHLKYMDSMIGKQATLLSAHHLLKEKGVLRKAGEPGTKPLLTAWKEAGYTERGLKTLIDDLAATGEAVTVQDLSKMAVGEDVARALSTIQKFTEPGPTAEYAKWWDRFLSLYRGALTLPFPGFHIRNLAGGVFQEATDNKVPLGTLLKGKIDAFRHLKNGGSLQYLDEAVELGVLDYHTQASMLFGEEAARQMGGPPTSLTELFGKPVAEARQKGLRKALDPLAFRGVKAHPEDLARAGKKENLNLLAEFGESSYKFVEFLNRAGYYEALRRSGYTPAQAVRYVKRAHFDYCVDEETEVLTSRGWLKWHDIREDDEALAIDPTNREIVWSPIETVNVFDYDGHLTRFKSSRMDALTTDEHRWLLDGCGVQGGHWTLRLGEQSHFRTTKDVGLKTSDRLILGGGTVAHAPQFETFSDEFVELVGWYVTEGSPIRNSPCGIVVTQSRKHNPEYVRRIERLAQHYSDKGCTTTVYPDRDCGNGPIATVYFGRGIGHQIRNVANKKQMSPIFLASLTERQLRLLYDTLMDGDGHRNLHRNGSGTTDVWAQKDTGRLDSFQMLTAMLGLRTNVRTCPSSGCSQVSVYKTKFCYANRLKRTRERYVGKVWCPTTGTGTWMARRNGITYWTGNSSLSSFEKNVARRLGPMFYGWQRKSIPYTMLKIMERPFGKTSQAIRATTIPQRDREEYIPGFMREKMSIPVSADGPETTYLSQLGLPIEDLNQLSFEGLMPQFKRIGQRQLANLPPPISAPLEMLTGTQFYTGRPLKYLDSPTEDVLGTKMPLVDRALSVGPWSRGVGELRRLTDQRKWEEPFPWDVLQILANVGTGAKFATYDTEKWKTIDAMNALTEQLEQQPDVAQYEVNYVPEKYRATVDPETQEKIKRARQLQELLTRMATIRQAQQRP